MGLLKNLNRELLVRLNELKENRTVTENKAKTALLYAMYLWAQDSYEKSTRNEEVKVEPAALQPEAEKEIINSLVGTAYYYINKNFAEVFKYIFLYENYDIIDDACENACEVLGNVCVKYEEFVKDKEFERTIGVEYIKNILAFLFGYKNSKAWGDFAKKVIGEKELNSSVILAEWIKFAGNNYVEEFCRNHFERQNKREAKDRLYAPNYVANNSWIFEKQLENEEYIKKFGEYVNSVRGFADVADEVIRKYFSLILSDGGMKYKNILSSIVEQISDVTTLLQLLEENRLADATKETLAAALLKKIEGQTASRVITDENIRLAVALDEDNLSRTVFDAFAKKDANLWRGISENVGKEKREEFYALICRLRVGRKAERCKAAEEMKAFLEEIFSEENRNVLKAYLNKQMLLLNETEEVKEEAEKQNDAALLTCVCAWEDFVKEDSENLTDLINSFEKILQTEEYDVINRCGMLLAKWMTYDCDRPEIKEDIKRVDIKYYSKESVYGYFLAHFMDPDGWDILSKYYFETKNNPMRDAVNLMEVIKFPDDRIVLEYALPNVRRSMERTGNSNIAPNMLINNAYLLSEIKDESYFAEHINQVSRSKRFRYASVRTVEKYLEYFCEVSNEESGFEEDELTFVSEYAFAILGQTAYRPQFGKKSAIEMMEEMYCPDCRLERAFLRKEKRNGSEIYVNSTKLILLIAKFYESTLVNEEKSKIGEFIHHQLKREFFYEKDRIAYDWLIKVIDEETQKKSKAFFHVSKLIFSFYPKCDVEKICESIDMNYLIKDNDETFWELLGLMSCVLADNSQLQRKIYRYIADEVSLGSEASKETLTVLERVLKNEKENRYAGRWEWSEDRTRKSYWASRYLLGLMDEETDMNALFEEMEGDTAETSGYKEALCNLHKSNINEAWKKNIAFCGITNYWDAFVERFLAEEDERVRKDVKEELQKYLPVIHATPLYRRILQTLVYSAQAVANMIEKEKENKAGRNSAEVVKHADVSGYMRQKEDTLEKMYSGLELLCELNPYLHIIRQEKLIKDDSRAEMDYVLKNSHVDPFLRSSKKNIAPEGKYKEDALCLAVLALFDKQECVALMDGVCGKDTIGEDEDKNNDIEDLVKVLKRLLRDKRFVDVLTNGICEVIGNKGEEEKEKIRSFVSYYYMACAHVKKKKLEDAQEYYEAMTGIVPKEYEYHYNILGKVLSGDTSKIIVGLAYKENPAYSRFVTSFVEAEKNFDNFVDLLKMFRSKETNHETKCKLARKIFYSLLFCGKRLTNKYYDCNFFTDWAFSAIEHVREKRFSCLYELLLISPDFCNIRLESAFCTELHVADETLLKIDYRKIQNSTYDYMKEIFKSIRSRFLELLEQSNVGIYGDEIQVWELEKTEREFPLKVAACLKEISEEYLKDDESGDYIRLQTAYELLKNNKVDSLQKQFNMQDKDKKHETEVIDRFAFYQNYKDKVNLYKDMSSGKLPFSVSILNELQDESKSIFYKIVRKGNISTDNLTVIFKDADGKLISQEVDAKAFFGEKDTFYDEITMTDKKEVKVEGIYWGEKPYAGDAVYQKLVESTEIVEVKSERAVRGEESPCVRMILDGLTDGFHVVFYNEGNSDTLVDELKKLLKISDAFQSRHIVEVNANETVPASENNIPRIVVWKEFSGDVKLRSTKSDLYVIDRRHLLAEHEKRDFETEIDFSEDNCLRVIGERDIFSKYRKRTVNGKERELTEETARYMEKSVGALVEIDEKNKALDDWMKKIYDSVGKGIRTYIYPSDAAQHYDVILGTKTGVTYIDNSKNITQNNYHITQINNNISITQNTLNYTIEKQIQDWYEKSEFFTDIKGEDGGLKKYEALLNERLRTIQLQKAKLEGQLELQTEGSETYNTLKAEVEKCSAEEEIINAKLDNLEDSFEADLGKAFEEKGKITDTQICELLGISEEEYTELKEILNLNNVISGQKNYNRKFLNTVYLHKKVNERNIADDDYFSVGMGYGIIVEGMLKRLHAKIYDARFCTEHRSKRWWTDKPQLMLGAFNTHLNNNFYQDIRKISDEDIPVLDPATGAVIPGQNTNMRALVRAEWQHSISNWKLQNRLDGLCFSGYASPECRRDVNPDGTTVARNTCKGCPNQTDCPVYKAWGEHRETMKVVHPIRNDSGHDGETEVAAVTRTDIDKLVEALFQKSAIDGMSGYQRIVQLYRWFVGNHDYWNRPSAATQTTTPFSNTTSAQPVQPAPATASGPAQSTTSAQNPQVNVNNANGITEALLNGHKTDGKKLLFWCNRNSTLPDGTISWSGVLELPEGDVVAHATGNNNILAGIADPTKKHYTATINEVKRKPNGVLFALIKIENQDNDCVFERKSIGNNNMWFGAVLWDGEGMNRKSAAKSRDIDTSLQGDTSPANKSYRARVKGQRLNPTTQETEFYVEILSQM